MRAPSRSNSHTARSRIYCPPARFFRGLWLAAVAFDFLRNDGHEFLSSFTAEMIGVGIKNRAGIVGVAARGGVAAKDLVRVDRHQSLVVLEFLNHFENSAVSPQIGRQARRQR